MGLLIVETAIPSTSPEEEYVYEQEQEQEQTRLRLRWDWLIPIALAVVAILVYADTFDYQILYSWDDNRYLNENHLIRDLSPGGLWSLMTERYFAANIPVTLLSYAIEYNIWGLDSGGPYHVTNVLLHAINGALVYFFLMRLLNQRIAALLAALIWVVHPIQVESVAWISQRKNLLSMMFTLLAFLAHMRSADDDAPRWALPTAWGMYLLAAFAKPAVVGVPFLFMIYDFFFARKTIPQTLVRNAVPLAIGAASAALILFAHDEGGGIKEHRGGSIFVTAQIMLMVYWDYLVALVNPSNLNNFYLYPLELLEQQPLRVLLGGLLLLTMLGIAVASLLRWWRTREAPLAMFAIAWIVLFMLPVSNIVPIAIERTDRYMYFPTVVIFAGIGLLFVRLWAFGARDERMRYVLSGALVALIFPLLFLTAGRIPVWTSSETLWRDHLTDYPLSNTGWLNLGVYYFNEQEFDRATPVFQRLLEINPTHFKGNRFMGSIAFNEGRLDEAVQYYQTAIRSDASDPLTYAYLGRTYSRANQPAEAVTAYRAMVERDPDGDMAWTYADFGNVALRIEDHNLAVQVLEAALRRDANNAQAASDLCAALSELGQLQEAVTYCQRAVDIAPQNGFYLGRLAHVMLLADQYEEALPVSLRAVEVSPNSTLAYRVLGDALAGVGDTEQAVRAYQQAVELDANNRRAIEGLNQLTGASSE